MTPYRLLRSVAAAVLCLGLSSPPAPAQERGPVTTLPLPRFVSLKVSEGNLRSGPSRSHRIDWVLIRRGMPLQVIAEYDQWRRVVDHDGVAGWVHSALLSGSRTALVDAEQVTLYGRPDPDTTEIAVLERGVVARLDRCTPNWCRLSAGGYRGWAPKGGYWGVGPDEVLD